jgi:hypothetical protein
MGFFKTAMSKRYVITLSAFVIFPPIGSQAQNGAEDARLVPITYVFYKVGDHLVGSFTDNYGLSYLLAGAGTYGIVKSGLDCRWYRNAQDHKWISDAGFVFVGIGPLASVAVPVGLYLYGRSKEDARLQYTGLAVTTVKSLNLPPLYFSYSTLADRPMSILLHT